MDLDTHVDGNPDAVRAIAAWLRDEFAARVDATSDTMYSIRNNVDASWDGPASEAACRRLTHGAERVDDMAEAARTVAADIDNLASELNTVHNRMAEIRRETEAAGLVVQGPIIGNPGGASDAALDAAFDAALHAAEAAREIEHLAGVALKNSWAHCKDKWFFVVGDLLNAAGRTVAARQASSMTKEASRLMTESGRYLQLAQSAPPGTPAASVYRDMDWSRTVASNSDELTRRADDVTRTAGRVGLGLGGGLAVAGVVYDIHAGKPVDQAIVSGGLGFGASVAAGAAIGSLIPAPMFGTAAGVLVGAGVGIFTSGAVDSLLTEGPGHVGEAFDHGVAAVADTGSAIGDLATGAWDALF